MEKLPALLLPSRNGFRFANFSEIIYCRADRGYIQVKLSDGGLILLTGKMKKLQEILPKPPFLRCHHSWLVNLSFVEELHIEDGSAMLMISGESIPVSREKRQLLLGLFHRL